MSFQKSLFALAILSTFAFGAELDIAHAKTTWTGYKFYDKTPVSGTFKDITYIWGKDTRTLAGTLKGAQAIIKGVSVDLNDPLKNKNVSEGFFAHFKKPEIIVVIDEVVPTDENKGRLEAKIEMNGVRMPVPVWLPYTITNNTFVAKGHVDLNDFSLGAALAKLHETCKPLHEGKTWAEAGITLEIPLKP